MKIRINLMTRAREMMIVKKMRMIPSNNLSLKLMPTLILRMAQLQLNQLLLPPRRKIRRKHLPPHQLLRKLLLPQPRRRTNPRRLLNQHQHQRQRQRKRSIKRRRKN